MPSVRASEGRAPGPEPKIARPAGHVVELHDALGDVERVVVGQRNDAGAEPDAAACARPAAARNISGEAIISQPDEWCSPHQNSSKPSWSRCAARSRSRWNCSVGCSPTGWWGRGRRRNGCGSSGTPSSRRRHAAVREQQGAGGGGASPRARRSAPRPCRPACPCFPPSISFRTIGQCDGV